MAAENKSKSNNGSKNNNKRRNRYLPHNKPVKKGSYPLHPGVQGFFITCDGGRELQASREAINVIEDFYEELVHGRGSDLKHSEISNIPLNKKTKFMYSDSSSSDDNDEEDDNQNDEKDIQKKDKEDINHVSLTNDNQRDDRGHDANNVSSTNEKSDPCEKDDECCENEIKENTYCNKEEAQYHEKQEAEAEEPPAKKAEAEEPPAKKQCLETDASKCGKVVGQKIEEKSVDKLIEAELAELGDRSKRRFSNLDSGCNGVVFIQMRKGDEYPGPNNIVQHMMTSVAATKKHMSRFMLRVLPIEVTCYASGDEIATAIKPLIARYFPVETETPLKFAVLYDARANTGIDRMKIIDTVAKSVTGPHKVDLNNPDIHIVVQICKIHKTCNLKELDNWETATASQYA
ncbi:unnamed protein product [Ilex paraguariensis]|uniref:THUMP domain-containing protein n=1 Tax=Ilex paraguariensis TaxID=185542 RepID=A0ABC8UTG3_9AQUA